MAESSSHSTLHSIAVLATIAGFLLIAYSIYLAVGQPGTQQPSTMASSQNVNDNANGAGSNSSADLVNSGQSGINESYTGMHKYFNDWKPLAVISIILIVGGLSVLSRGRPSVGTKP